MSVVYDKHNHKMVDTDFHDSFCSNCGDVIDASDELEMCPDCEENETRGMRYG